MIIAAQTSGVGNSDCVWHLFLDDIDVNQSAVFSSADSVWATNYFTFTATMATHKIGVRAYTPTFGSPGSAAIDNFVIAASEPTGIEDNISKNVLVFPDPVKNELKIESQKLKIARVEIYNLLGEKMLIKSYAGSPEISVIDFPAGVYFAEIYLDNSSIKRIKFVKE